MIEFQLRTNRGAIFPRLRVETLKDGLEGALFVIGDLKPAEDWWLALLDRGPAAADFPTLPGSGRPDPPSSTANRLSD
jgi:hypothetical protein